VEVHGEWPPFMLLGLCHAVISVCTSTLAMPRGSAVDRSPATCPARSRKITQACIVSPTPTHHQLLRGVYTAILALHSCCVAVWAVGHHLKGQVLCLKHLVQGGVAGRLAQQVPDPREDGVRVPNGQRERLFTQQALPVHHADERGALPSRHFVHHDRDWRPSGLDERHFQIFRTQVDGHHGGMAVSGQLAQKQ